MEELAGSMIILAYQLYRLKEVPQWTKRRHIYITDNDQADALDVSHWHFVMDRVRTKTHPIAESP